MDVAALRAALPGGLVALDFDGTLAPISARPGDARPLGGVGQLLRDVRATGATLAVVTGRTVASVLRVSGFDAIPGIVIYGTHGAERWQAGHLRAPAPPAGLEELRVSLPGLLTSVGPDLWLEDKALSLVIHARLTADPDRILELLRPTVGEAALAVGLGVRPGKEVLEICIPGLDKGAAVHELLSDDPAGACYAGDDLGDLPAIGAVNTWAERTGRPGLTVAVSTSGGGPVASQAGVTVPDPPALLSLLRQIFAVPAPAVKPPI